MSEDKALFSTSGRQTMDFSAIQQSQHHVDAGEVTQSFNFTAEQEQ